MVGSTYVSDPRVWKSFYKNMIDGKFNPGYYRGRQTGGGIANMYSKKPYMVPVNRHVTTEPEQKVVIGKEVTPSAAAEDRARSEMKDAIQDDLPHVPVGIKGIKPHQIVSTQPRTEQRSSRKKDPIKISFKSTIKDPKRKSKTGVQATKQRKAFKKQKM